MIPRFFGSEPREQTSGFYLLVLYRLRPEVWGLDLFEVTDQTFLRNVLVTLFSTFEKKTIFNVC
ncbi:MAG: hypothetical protein EA390_11720 [Balneolaceae bacterium]|nr:MAG: hypothetical protein EA390_11720 [Balneolaceae bacterium]